MPSLNLLLASLLTLIALPGLADERDIQWEFPRTTVFEAGQLTIHSPQVIAWDNFETARFIMAVEYHPDRKVQSSVYAVVEMQGETTIDLQQRLVRVTNRKLLSTKVHGKDRPAYTQKLAASAVDAAVVAPLDVFLLSLAQDAVELKNHEGFSDAVPDIKIATEPTILLSVIGKPFYKPMESAPYSLVSNANWPLLKHRVEQIYYLRHQAGWWTSKNLKKGWKTSDTPPGLEVLDADGEFKDFLQPISHDAAASIRIEFVTNPAELIVFDGAPQTAVIADAGELAYATNTRSPLLMLAGDWYYLSAGRWFKTASIKRPRWALQVTLPVEFSWIPVTHEMAYVRSSVPGTIEAQTALLESMLPLKKSVSISEQLTLTDIYEGEPVFERIASTDILRAVNSPYDLFDIGGSYYLCLDALWYQGASAMGPWTPATSIPDVVYDIPAESPAYAVTQVVVSNASEGSVVYSATDSYFSGVFNAYGMPVYGTGWSYPAYFGERSFYHGYRSFGLGSIYSPAGGRYIARSSWYGPYGGYSYGEYYADPAARRNRVHATWQTDSWTAHRDSYQPGYGEIAAVGSALSQSTGVDNDSAADSLYATADGEIFRHQGDRWYRYDRISQWEEIDDPRMPLTTTESTQAQSRATSGNAGQSSGHQLSDKDRRTSSRLSQVSRDSHARNMGADQFESRRDFENNSMSMGRMDSRW